MKLQVMPIDPMWHILQVVQYDLDGSAVIHNQRFRVLSNGPLLGFDPQIKVQLSIMRYARL